MKARYFYLIGLVIFVISFIGSAKAVTQHDVAVFVRDSVLAGSLSGYLLLMSDSALSGAYFARDPDPLVPDVYLPYAKTWVTLIDSMPNARWEHRCSWMFLNDVNLSEYQMLTGKYSPPSIWLDTIEVRFGCIDFTYLGADSCPELGPFICSPPSPIGEDKDCLYAILISGGLRDVELAAKNAKDLEAVYRLLRKCGYPKKNIFTYYDFKETKLDLDNVKPEDNEVTGALKEEDIKKQFTKLCAELVSRLISPFHYCPSPHWIRCTLDFLSRRKV